MARKRAINGYTVCRAKARADEYIEYNCMNPECYDMWDLHITEEPRELCPRCGSNNIHSMPAPHIPRHKRYVDEEQQQYHGADIFDQYGHPGY